MFYAKGQVSQKIDVYSALLDKSLSDGTSSSYWKFFENAFHDAHSLATGSKTHFQIDRNAYDLVSILFKSNAKYFKDLDVSKIDDRVFLDVKTFIQSLKQSNSVITSDE
jgi:hypothetical protein